MTMRWSFLALAALCAALAGEAGAAPKTAPKSAPPAAPRRLEDVRIEGDVPVPQVVFVTARDPRRFLEFQHGRYRKTSLELARESVLPTRVVLVGGAPAVPHKESAP
jgi:hypothetical protein